MTDEAAPAARAVGYRVRSDRSLLTTPIFRAALEKEIEALRKGEHARSLRTIVRIRDEPGGDKAADRRVRLEAARTLIGETGGTQVSVSVSQIISPGYVIRLPAPKEPGPIVGTLDASA
jgi:hypothetical protein